MNTVALDEQILRKNREFIEFFVLSRQSHQTKCPPGSVELLKGMTASAQAEWDRIRHYQSLPMFAGTIYRTLIGIVSQATAASELAAHFSTLAYRAEHRMAHLEISEYERKAVKEHQRLSELLASIVEVLLREADNSFKSNTTRYELALHVAELLSNLTRSLDRQAGALELAATARARLGETLLAHAQHEKEESARKQEQIALRKALQTRTNKSH